MSNMKCPYCDKPLHCGAQLNSDGNIIELYQCANPECESTEFLVGCKEFWDILGQHKRTRKALGVAVDALNKIINAQGQCWGATDTEIKFDCKHYASEALEQITAEQKEEK